jgi:tetratricopeptide (TPR) repeat protein
MSKGFPIPALPRFSSQGPKREICAMKEKIPAKRGGRGIDTGNGLGGKSPSKEELSMSDGNLLSSWKEIAAYLGCDIKTCGRWEKESGLPIRRITPGAKRSRVFAYKADLDHWLSERNIIYSQEAAGSARKAKRRPFAIGAVVLLIGAPAVWFVGRAISPAPLPPLLAVREIRPEAIQAADRYLAKQMTEQIAQRLEFGGGFRIRKVAAEAPAFRSGDAYPSGLPRPDYWFEARLRPAGAKYSLAVDLKDARTGGDIFADTITASPGEFGLRLNAVCEEIRRRIPEALASRKAAEASFRGQVPSGSMKGVFPLQTLDDQSADPVTLYYQGLQYAGLGNADANELALGYFNRALALDPTFAPAYLGLAQCYSNYVNYEARYDPKWLDKAEDFLARAQARQPDQAEYFVLRIKALLLREIVFGGDFSRAYFELARKALAIHPYNGRLAYVVGQCYVRAFERGGADSDFRKALRYYQVSVAADPAALENLNFAQLLTLDRKFVPALAVVANVLNGRPSMLTSFARGEILYFQGDLEGSLASFALCDSPPESKIAALYYMAMIAARKADRGRAEGLLRQIELLEVRKEPIYLDHLRTASVFAGLGDTEKALALLNEGYRALGGYGTHMMRRYVELDPNFARLPGNLVARRSVASNLFSKGAR